MIYYILILLFYSLLLVINFKYLVRANKTKDSSHWIISLTINLISIICSIFIGKNITDISGTLINSTNQMNEMLTLVLFGELFVYVMPVLYSLMALVNVILRINYDANKNTTKNRLTGDEINRSIAVPTLLIISITCIVFGAGIVYQDSLALTKKSETGEAAKEKLNAATRSEAQKMVKYLNDKYDTNITIDDFVKFYQKSSKIGKPYIGIFNVNGKTVTVDDVDGKMSDNAELDKINQLITNYFSKKIGVNFDYVEFYEHDYDYNNIINRAISTKYNGKITEDNVGELVNYMLNVLVPTYDNIYLRFFVKADSYDKTYTDDVKSMISSSLFEEGNIGDVEGYSKYENLHIALIEYKGDLDVEYQKIDDADNSYDRYKFGCYQVSNDSDLTYQAEGEYEYDDGVFKIDWHHENTYEG